MAERAQSIDIIRGNHADIVGTRYQGQSHYLVSGPVAAAGRPVIDRRIVLVGFNAGTFLHERLLCLGGFGRVASHDDSRPRGLEIVPRHFGIEKT